MRLRAALIWTSLLAVSCAMREDVVGVQNRLGDLERQNSKSSDEIRANQKRLEATLAAIQTKVLVDIEAKQKRIDDNLKTMLRNSADDKEEHNSLNERLNVIGGSIDEVVYRLKQEEERLNKLEAKLRDEHRAMTESFLANTQKIETMRNQLGEQSAAVKARLDEQSAAVTARLDEQFAAVSARLDKQLDASARLGEELAAVSTRLEELRQSSPKTADKKKKKEKEKSPKKADKVKGRPPKEADEETESTGEPEAASQDDLYNAAYDDFLNGNYDKAGAKFSEFLKRYPNSELSYNSQYWIGEALANQGRAREAVEAFKLTAANYPKSTKAPAALWRAAEITEKTGSREDLRAILGKIRDNYPASQEAVMADEKLIKLNVRGKQE
ncbi:MAG: tol-pal system protein YbgF [Nitrospinae bacterium]|nr:tol-pal system protein YbgF [Nitrospinota bacterium]